MTSRIHTIRFLDNNLAIRDIATYITYSSALAVGPFANCQLDARSKTWIPAGNFDITATNNKMYITAGSSNYTITITIGSYSITTLCAEIKSKMDAVYSNFTVSYSSTLFMFSIVSNIAPITLILSQTTNSIWDTLGFTTTSDITASSFTADQQRNHTSEWVIWDLTAQRDILAFCCICPINEIFGLSSSAVITLEANNVNSWSSPPFSQTLTRTDNGIFNFFDNLTDYSYRYVRFRYVDRMNTLGPNGVKFSHIYLGDYFTLDNDRPVSYGYNKLLVDPSVSSATESGTLYFDNKIKYSEFNGIGLSVLKRDQKDAIEYFFKTVGLNTAFYISIDPLGLYTDDLGELTKYVFFKDSPVFSHTVKDFFTTAINLREVV